MDSEVASKVKEISNKNPSAILDSIAEPSPLTISQIAILEKISSPILNNDITNLGENIKATYIVNIPYRDAVKCVKDGTLEEKAMEWADGIGWDEFQIKMCNLVIGIVGFWKMMPPQESDELQKKKEVAQGK